MTIINEVNFILLFNYIDLYRNMYCNDFKRFYTVSLMKRWFLDIIQVVLVLCQGCVPEKVAQIKIMQIEHKIPI
jgi:hypothetical protein